MESTEERFPSRVAGLDRILNGGFLQTGIYIVMGRPGTGKTILGNQIAFNHVAAGGKAAYVTLLAEQHSRMLAHLSAMRFFRADSVSSSLSYFSGYSVLEREGLKGLLDHLGRLVRETGATLLVLDGLTAAAVNSSPIAFKKFIHELQVLLGLIRCSAFLLTNANGDADPDHPELTMVDGLIELSDSTFGLRAVREIEVRKFRGGAHLRGKHSFEIDDTGIVIHPRLESRACLTNEPPPPAGVEVVESGVPGLDAMLGGGLHRGSLTALIGQAGAGKTLLGSTFLCGSASKGGQLAQRAHYFGFYESPERLICLAESVGLDLARHVREGQLELTWQAPTELTLDALADRILETCRARRVERLFIDGMVSFMESTVYPERMGRFFAALGNELRRAGVTTLVSHIGDLGLLTTRFDAIVGLELRNRGEHWERMIGVMKATGRAHDLQHRPLVIDARGVRAASATAPKSRVTTATKRKTPKRRGGRS